jgi:hypothetical protein
MTYGKLMKNKKIYRYEEEFIMKFYTENKMMYFEVTECEGIFAKGKYKIDAYNKIYEGEYSYERDMTEEMMFNSKKEANIVAEAFSFAYDWGNSDAKKRRKTV